MKKNEKTTKFPYSMRVVSRLTGLSSDIIRKWEQRYRAVVPSRTQGGTRKFSAAQVQRLKNLKALTDRGHAIQQVAVLSDESLVELLAEKNVGFGTDKETIFDRLRTEYLLAIEIFDVHKALSRLGRASALLSPDDFIFQVALPLLRETGDRWHRGEFSVAHEHLVSSQMHALLTIMSHQQSPQPGAPRVVVTTPEGHLHEFGALVAALLLAVRGFDPIYLKANLPEDDIVQAIHLSKADLLILSVVRSVEGTELQRLIASIKRMSRHAEVWLGLPAGHSLADGGFPGRVFHSFEDLDMALTQRRSTQKK
jgi:methanogenic corrinoid protein MtbC1